MKELRTLRSSIESKASKNAILDGQQTFFDDLNKVETEVDKKRDKFIMDEFKRLGDKIYTETN